MHCAIIFSEDSPKGHINYSASEFPCTVVNSEREKQEIIWTEFLEEYFYEVG